MRLRNKPWAKERIAELDYLGNLTPEQTKGKWNSLFETQQPIHIEIGMGKGDFIIGMAKQNPHINYIGIEKFDSVLVIALEKLKEAGLTNVKLISYDAIDLEKIFDKGEVSQVYLNFSDPWPKKRHDKRRLTHKSFLAVYQNILIDGGEIHFKTDNRSLFEYSLVSLNNYPMKFKDICLDLHKSDYPNNVKTEYEIKFSAKGFPIYRLEAAFINEKN